jgi:hypothetical protein
MRKALGRGQALLVVADLLLALLVLTLFMFVLGCGSVTPHSRVTETIHIELNPEDYEFITRVEGSDSVGRYLFLFKFYTPNSINGTAEAIKQAPAANWLVNRHLSVQEEIYVPLIYHRQCV